MLSLYQSARNVTLPWAVGISPPIRLRGPPPHPSKFPHSYVSGVTKVLPPLAGVGIHTSRQDRKFSPSPCGRGQGEG